MGEIRANGKLTAEANAEIEAGVTDLRRAFERILGGIAQHREAIGVKPLNEFRDKVEADAKEAQTTAEQLAVTLLHLTAVGSRLCQELITLDESHATDIWHADPGKWRGQSLPDMPPGVEIPDMFPGQS